MITIISGKPGVGKTAYLAYLCAMEIQGNGFENYLSSKREIKYMNNHGFNLDLPPQKHICFSDIPLHISKRISAYEVDGYQIAMPNVFFETVALPPYSTIFLDEAQKYYDSRYSKVLREDVYRWYQLHRHNHYNIFMTCQRLGNIDLNIRAIADKFVVIDSIDIRKNEYGITTKVTWKMHEFNSVELAEKYQLESDSKEFKEIGKEKTVSTTLPVFSFYDSYQHKPAFYADNSSLEFNYYFASFYDLSLEDIARFNYEHSITSPIGYYKNAEYDKKILKNLGV